MLDPPLIFSNAFPTALTIVNGFAGGGKADRPGSLEKLNLPDEGFGLPWVLVV
jgi:hypothetical protein